MALPCGCATELDGVLAAPDSCWRPAQNLYNDRVNISSDDQKGISVILFYLALLFFLVGMAARMKSDFHSRGEISSASLATAAVLVVLGVIVFLFARRKKQH